MLIALDEHYNDCMMSILDDLHHSRQFENFNARDSMNHDTINIPAHS
jgi:hypothetical protein